MPRLHFEVEPILGLKSLAMTGIKNILEILIMMLMNTNSFLLLHQESWTQFKARDPILATTSNLDTY